MPELPEVETARAVLERAALDRRIVDVDDSDTFVLRPHLPGDVRAALVGRCLTAAHRQGKSMWCDTSDGGPVLGIHLGMSGKIVIAEADGTEIDGGDYWERGRQPGDYRFTRFALAFADGGRMLLVDPRRLGRVRLDPPVEKLGPDARAITPAQFRTAITRGDAPVKARLLDQHALAGVGNLLADEILWQAGISPRRRTGSLSDVELDELRRATRRAIRNAIRRGGAHTGELNPERQAGGRCPRDGTELARARIGGRTTYWCPEHQPDTPGASS